MQEHNENSAQLARRRLRIQYRRHQHLHRLGTDASYARRLHSADEQTFIYVITDGTFTKVGQSHDPQQRLGIMQSGNPYDLSLAWTARYSCAKAAFVEARVYLLLLQVHVRGEWYRAQAAEAINSAQAAAAVYLRSPAKTAIPFTLTPAMTAIARQWIAENGQPE